MPVPATGKSGRIDEQIYARLRNNSRDKLVGEERRRVFLPFRSRNLTASRSADDVVKEYASLILSR